MTERQVQQSLFPWIAYRLNHQYFLPNMQSADGEIDFFGLSKAGLGYDFEIKNSKADLMREIKDAEHARNIRAHWNQVPTKFPPEDYEKRWEAEQRKRELLKGCISESKVKKHLRHLNGTCFVNYWVLTVPTELLEAAQAAAPPHAGIVEIFSRDGKRFYPQWVTKPTRLHKEKTADKINWQRQAISAAFRYCKSQ